MFKLYDDFSVCDDNKQPYSIKAERHTPIDNLHAGVENNEFALKSIGNRFVFKTPMLSDFDYEMEFGFTCIYEFKPSFTVAYGYDKKSRCGYGVSLVYNLDKTVTISHVTVSAKKTNVIDRTIASVTCENVEVTEGKRYKIKISKKGTTVSCIVFDKSFDFETDAQKGYLAIYRPNYIGMCLIKNLKIESDDKMENKTVLKEKCCNIPTLNGGDIPYELTISAVKENEKCYLNISLGGGTAARELNRDDRPGQYVAEVDTIRAPYIKINNGKKEEKIYIYNDEQIIADPNIYWDCLKEYWNMPEMPIQRKTEVSEDLFGENTTITYGYVWFSAMGYAMQSGGPSEFVFDRDGNLLYSGAALENDVYEIKSPRDKKILSYISKETYNYENVKAHLESNHYFVMDEKIKLNLVMITDKQSEQLTAEAEIRDVYDSRTIQKLSATKLDTDEILGLNKLTWKAEGEPLCEGVYRIIYKIFYGGTMIKSFGRVFEVLDPGSKISPATASGLPYVFSMPNEHKWLERNSFDLWNPMPSCDLEHYISCVTDTPIEAKKRRVWEILPPFKREWFAWLDSRTCKDWSLENHLDVVENCDYLYYPVPIQLYPLRNDLCLLQTYTYNPRMMALLREFVDLNPQIEEKLSFDLPETDGNKATEMLFEVQEEDTGFTYENLREFLDLCLEEWYDYVLVKLNQEVKKQNDIIKTVNPGFKRSAYGPYNQYVSATLSYNTIRSFGMLPDERLRKDVYTGFAIFEDYPYYCNYQTYRGAFGVMTTLLHVPDLVIYPEQYKDSKLGGCIDGAVKFAHAPMGAFVLEAYESSTNAFEYVFNTPQRTNEGYKYWSTYGFHRYDFEPERWDRVVKDWKYVIDYKPNRPLRTTGFVAEYCDRENVLDTEIDTIHKTAGIKNRSEHGHGFLYDCCREAGLNAGFAIKSETLMDLSEDECQMLVLPTLRDADKEVVSAIRRLYENGVALVAVSDIPGLEDIFGVAEDKRKVTIDTLYYAGQSEDVYPIETEVYYKATSSETLLWAEDGAPVVLRNGNALLINAPVTDIGFESFEGMAGIGRHCLSQLLKSCIKKTVRELSTHVALGENVGITLFKTEKGATVLMAIDYSPFDNMVHDKRRACVDIYMDGIKNVKSDREIICLKNSNEDIYRLEFDILKHETVFIELI